MMAPTTLIESFNFTNLKNIQALLEKQRVGKENHSSKYVVISKQSGKATSTSSNHNVINTTPTPTSYQINRYTCQTTTGDTIRVVPLNNNSSAHRPIVPELGPFKPLQQVNGLLPKPKSVTRIVLNSKSNSSEKHRKDCKTVSLLAKDSNSTNTHVCSKPHAKAASAKQRKVLVRPSKPVGVSACRQTCKTKTMATAAPPPLPLPPLQQTSQLLNQKNSSPTTIIIPPQNINTQKDIVRSEAVPSPGSTISIPTTSQVPTKCPPGTTPLHAIEFKDYSKPFKLCNLSLTISSGSKIAVVGPSNLKYLYKALSKPSKIGSVWVHGKAAGSEDMPGNSVIYIQEQPEFESDVLIRILGGKVTDTTEQSFLQAHYALMMAGLLQIWQIQVQRGFKRWIFIDVDALDDKDRQLLLMARAIYSDYKVVIIEQTICSDKLVQQQMYNLMFGAAFQTKTVLFSPFYLDHATLFDKFLVFNSNGVLVEQGHADHLLKDQSCKLYAMESSFPRLDPKEPRISSEPLEFNFSSVFPAPHEENIFENPFTGELNFIFSELETESYNSFLI